MDREIIELDAGWSRCRKYIDQLEKFLEKESPSAFSCEEYMSFYTIVYNMCTQKNPYDYSQELYARYKESFESYIKQKVAPALLEKSGEAMLHELTQRWENHKLMVRLLSRIFKYLDRYYVSRYNLDYLNDVGLMCFRDLAYAKIKHNVKGAVLSLIHKEREGESIDRNLVKTVLEIFVEIGLGTMDAYQDDFEKFLLEETAAYYKNKAVDWIQEDTCPAYMIKAEKCIDLEKSRVSNTESANSGYLHATTETKLLQSVDAELLTAYESQLLEKENSGCVALLRDDKKEDLARMYRLFSRIPKGKEPVALVLRKHIENEGMVLVEDTNQRASIKEEKGKGKGPRPGRDGIGPQENAFVKKLIKLHDKYLQYVVACFQNDSQFLKALKEAFEFFCNKQVGKTSPAEMLASFSDNLLRKGSGEKLSDDSIEDTFEKIVKLLAYISDKDLFQEFYRKKLAKRLLHDRSANEDYERSMLARLKQQCGAQFTSKMEGMVNDLQVAKEQQGNFAEYLQNNPNKKPPVDMTVRVLTTGYWPNYKMVEMTLPKALEQGIEVFKEFYEVNTKHRRLQWVLTMGQCTIKANLARKFDLVMSTMQAATLLLFNGGEKLAFKEIMTRLNLPDSEMVRVLHSLSCAKYKLLLKEPEGKMVGKGDSFELNTQFTDRMSKIRIPLPPIDGEKKKVLEDVDKDRRYAIDAAVVRTMKARKTLKHQELMQEVIQQLSQMFKPDIKMIKRRIEDLISREYLERDSENSNVFKYMA